MRKSYIHPIVQESSVAPASTILTVSSTITVTITEQPTDEVW